jgi:hypothetical protein
MCASRHRAGSYYYFWSPACNRYGISHQGRHNPPALPLTQYNNVCYLQLTKQRAIPADSPHQTAAFQPLCIPTHLPCRSTSRGTFAFVTSKQQQASQAGKQPSGHTLPSVMHVLNLSAC